MKYEPWPGESRKVLLEVLAEHGTSLENLLDEYPVIESRRVDGSALMVMRMYDFQEPMRSSTLTLQLTPDQLARIDTAFGWS